MKKLLFGIILCLLPLTCLGQSNKQHCIEIEAGIGLLQSFHPLIFDSCQPGAVPYAEIKYYFKQVPVDIGFLASAQIFSRVSFQEKLDFMSKNLMLVGDYSFYHEPKYHFFAGIGVGIGFFDANHGIQRDEKGLYYSSISDENILCIMPRIGIRIGTHITLSLSYLFEDTANSNLNLRIGYAF